MGRMSKADALQFDEQIAADPQLKAEVALQTELIRGIEDEGLKSELKELHGELVHTQQVVLKNRIIMGVGGGLVLLVIGLLFIFKDNKPVGNDIPPDTPVTDSLAQIDTLPHILPEPALEETVAVVNNLPEKQPAIPAEVTPPSQPEEDTTENSPISPDTVLPIPQPPDTQETDIPASPADIPGMVFIPGGEFMMGGRMGNETPAHPVQVSAFYMDQHEVTNAAYCHFLNALDRQMIDERLSQWLITDPVAGSKIAYRSGQFVPRKGFESHPVVAITWHGAKAYAQWIGKRLPTEAEWEYAARGGGQAPPYPFAGSSNPAGISWNQVNSQNTTHPVGTKTPNSLGIYDLSGNAWEWCNDRFGPYRDDRQTDPIGPTYGTERVLRGGSFKDLDGLRVNARWHFAPHLSREHIGFRCVVD